MGDYPDVRADGANIEIELEKGFKITAYVGDPGIATLLEDLWSLRDCTAVRIAKIQRDLKKIGPGPLRDRELQDLLAGLRRQIDEFEASVQTH
ncbi:MULTISPECIES: hypothetical protein [unclassified Chelatococcus]|uniref:hypothetical protein n=1 Tax=unclassified Chelatococcus TaxID=2638111 RepID=UPI001BCC438A|nr:MULTISPECIES: hypothetical protein [unclassified Chelatococcus]MBS7700495.1 hypothetical protein [Chelatococcus sp. YT9]MBX3556291.1 hypothetical protein [Chelatococcus sp.]